MKVKMVDVARRLGISKATVSLAVNGKPGVNEATKQRILDCIEEMKNSDVQKRDAGANVIKVLILNHNLNVVCDPEMDLWSNVLNAFDTEARKQGFIFSLSYLGVYDENKDEIIEECNSAQVAGIILFGTEMTETDYPICGRIKKPMILYDYDMKNGNYTSVCIDNERAVELAIEYLNRKGKTEILYAATSKSIYNFEQRRKAFQSILLNQGMIPKKNSIIHFGSTIDEISGNVDSYIENQKIPDAIIAENYQVTIGMIQAFSKKGIHIGDKIRMVGIDEIPAYVCNGMKITQIQVPHAERAVMAMDFLLREIENGQGIKYRILSAPTMIEK